MKTELTNRFIESLEFNRRPFDDGKGIAYRENTEGTQWVIYDSTPGAPSGFGVRVGAKSKTFVLFTRVNGRKHTIKVGQYPEVQLIGSGRNKERDARAIAADMLFDARRGIDPTAEKKAAAKAAQRLENAPTLRSLFEEYRIWYISREKKPPKKNTLIAIKSTLTRLEPAKGGEGLLDKLATEITREDLERVFTRVSAKGRRLSAAEQTMIWISIVYNHRIRIEESDGLEPTLTRNPVRSVRHLMRDGAELRAATKDSRHPISNDMGELGAVLRELWAVRSSRTLAVDYTLTNLLLGTRKSEASRLQWGHKLTAAEKKTESWVDVRKEVVMFRDTKNRTDHELPLGSLLASIMLDRSNASGTSRYVFPTGHVTKKSKVPYYHSNRHFISQILKRSGTSWTMHDLRRTFSQVTNGMGIPTITLKRLLNHTDSDVTALYAAPSMQTLRDYMGKIEKEILRHAPEEMKAMAGNIKAAGEG